MGLAHTPLGKYGKVLCYNFSAHSGFSKGDQCTFSHTRRVKPECLHWAVKFDFERRDGHVSDNPIDSPMVEGYVHALRTQNSASWEKSVEESKGADGRNGVTVSMEADYPPCLKPNGECSVASSTECPSMRSELCRENNVRQEYAPVTFYKPHRNTVLQEFPGGNAFWVPKCHEVQTNTGVSVEEVAMSEAREGGCVPEHVEREEMCKFDAGVPCNEDDLETERIRVDTPRMNSCSRQRVDQKKNEAIAEERSDWGNAFAQQECKEPIIFEREEYRPTTSLQSRCRQHTARLSQVWSR